MADEARMTPERRIAIPHWVGFGVVFLAALAIRYAFVDELRAHSYLGNIRVSDARTYFQIANQILEGSLPFEPYWQAPLYPLLLSVFQGAFGNNLHSVQWMQIIVGAANCGLVFLLTRRLFGDAPGWIAGGIAAFYAPFWIFDAQPLPANWTAFFYLLAVLAYLAFRTSGKRGGLVGAAALLGAAVITHGLAILTLPVFVWDLVRGGGQARSSLRGNVALFLVVVAVLPVSVSVRNSLAAGEPVFVSYNAGINLYLGNHRDLEETLGRRGGFEWGEIFRAPYTSGAKAPAEMNRYFVRAALEQWMEAPLALCWTTLKKALISLSAHEPKRNFPIYPLREDSRLLHAFLFEVNVAGRTVFAFPGGLVIPLALFGVALNFRARRGATQGEPASTLCARVAIAHLIGMVIFFPTARYRLPALFLLLPYAGWMLTWLWARSFGRSGALVAVGNAVPRPARAGIALGLLAFATINAVSPNLFRQPTQDRAAHLYSAALWANEKLRFVNSESLEARLVALAEEAIRIDPDYPEPVGLLAVHHLHRDIDRSLAYFARLDELVPGDADVQRQLREALSIRQALLEAGAEPGEPNPPSP